MSVGYFSPVSKGHIKGRVDGIPHREYSFKASQCGGGGLVAKSCPTLATSLTIAFQVSLSMEFSRQEYWSGLPFPSPGDLPSPGIEPGSPTLQADPLLTELHQFSSVQFSSVAQSCLTLFDPMNCSTPGLPVHHQLPEFTQTHVYRVSDAIQPSHSLSSPSPPAPNPSQHQSLFQ